MSDVRSRSSEDGVSVPRPLTSVICLKLRACLNKSGAAAALKQGALAGGAGGVTRHADVVWRMGGAGRESSDRGGRAREIELEGAGRHRNGRRRAHLHWQRNEDDFRGGACHHAGADDDTRRWLRNVEEVALGDRQLEFDITVLERGRLRADLELDAHDLHEVCGADGPHWRAVEQD